MKKNVTKILFLSVFLYGTMISFMSCSKSDNSNDNTSNATSNTTTTTDPNALTPDAQKQKLDDAGSSLLNQVNPSDLQQTIKAINDFVNISSNANLRSASTSLRSVVATSDLNQMTNMLRSASANGYYTTKYATYTYNGTSRKWDSIPNTTALIFNYTSQNQQAQIKVQISSDFYTYVEGTTTKYVPKTFTYTMTLGTSTILTYNSGVSSFDKAAGVMAMNNSLTVPAANLTWYANVNLNTTQCSAEAGIKKGSTTLISATATTTGTSLTTTSNLSSNNVNKGSMKINVMDKLYFSVECPNIPEYSNKENQIESQYPEIDTYKYDGGTTSYYGYYHSEAYYKAVADLNNQYLLGYFNYDNSTAQAGKLYFDYKYNVQTQTYKYSYPTGYSNGVATYTDYTQIVTNDNSDILPGIQFVSDGSKYKYFDYFNNNNFASFVKTFTDLENNFKGILK
jgi:hypothetical protein